MRSASLVLAAVVSSLVCASPVWAASSSPAEAAAPAAAVVPVEASRVCMMNDRVFDRPMIPVEVAGKTYFGCCEMCKERIGASAELRSSTDPVSGNPVDKASAVAGALPDGRVLYFENKENLEALSHRMSPGS